MSSFDHTDPHFLVGMEVFVNLRIHVQYRPASLISSFVVAHVLCALCPYRAPLPATALAQQEPGFPVLHYHWEFVQIHVN